MLTLFRGLAPCIAWMNKNLYAHFGDGPDARRKQDLGRSSLPSIDYRVTDPTFMPAEHHVHG